MPKIPYKVEKSKEDEDDYEIVSFEDFCDKPSVSKNELSLNDNINYRLCYENDRSDSANDKEYKNSQELKETSLSGNKSVSWKKREQGFAPFGRSQPRVTKPSLLTSVVPKGKADTDSTSRDHRYQRFSDQRSFCEKFCRRPGIGSSFVLLTIVCAFAIVTYWMVCLIIGNAWGEEHYKRLWEHAHPDEPQRHIPSAPVVPYAHEKILPDFRYHDHNNLSPKNKLNATENSKKKSNKKSSNNTDRPIKVSSKVCLNVKEDMRFDCFPQENANEEACVERGCCWVEAANSHDTIPYCFYPPQYSTFHFLNMTENKHGITVYYENEENSSYPDDFEIAQIDFKYISNDVLQIKIQDAENKRFEPPYPQIPVLPGPINMLKYKVLLDSSNPGFKVIRVDDNVTILDNQDVGGMILSDKFLQLSTLLPAKNIYGLGERRSRFRLDMNWKTYSIFNHDVAPNENTNLYGSHPFYLALEETGRSHGMLLLNSHPIDVVLQPTPAITYRTIGGILNFFVFFGPSPTEVLSQYTSIIGKPFMPPYWSLGFHLCKFGYGSLKATEEVWQRTRDAGIPFDVQWNDLDYMNNSNMFTYDHDKFAGLPKFVDKLHSLGMHYIPLIDPGVSASEAAGQYPPYDRGLVLDTFIKNSTSQPFVGKVWNKGSTVWPDFTHPNSTNYWLEMLKSYHDEVKFDGAWTDMNEPSNFLSGSMYGSCVPENLPYRPHTEGEGLRSKTLCMDAKHFGGSHLEWHNLHSLTEVIATNFALKEIRGKRPFIISRSSFVGLGQYAGHWSGDIASDWHDMEMTIPELLSFSLFGIPMMGADICGFRGNTTPELCKRWMQLGAFYPFSRNHNSDTSTPQDPVSLGPEVTAAARRALRTRYSLLPTLYTLFWRAHVSGSTVARPLLLEFPNDTATHSIDDQFMLGPYILIAPILKQGANTSKPYLNSQHKWFNLLNGQHILPGSEVDENSTVLLRGQSVVVLQEAGARGAVSTRSARAQPLQLAAAAGRGRARAQLYWDDGDSLNSYEEQHYSLIEFTLDSEKQTLVSHTEWWGYGAPSVSQLVLYDISQRPKYVTLDGRNCSGTNSIKVTVNCRFSYNLNKRVLRVYTDIHLDKSFRMEWSFN